MSRYIDAEKLKEKLHSGDSIMETLSANPTFAQIYDEQRKIVAEVEKYIDETPTIDVTDCILDKIRTEIKGMTPTYHNFDWSITDLVPISEVLKIVDKYKAEREEE